MSGNTFGYVNPFGELKRRLAASPRRFDPRFATTPYFTRATRAEMMGAQLPQRGPVLGAVLPASIVEAAERASARPRSPWLGANPVPRKTPTIDEELDALREEYGIFAFGRWG